MSLQQKKSEIFFEKLARFTYTHRIKTLITFCFIIGAFAYACLGLKVDTATEAMLSKNDPSLIEYNTFRDEFGRSDTLIVLVEAQDIFDRDVLIKLDSLQKDLEAHLPHLKKVTSLINVRETTGENDVLHVDDLIGDPETADLEAVKKQALANPFYTNYVLSADQKSTAILIELVTRVMDKKTAEPADDLSGFESDGMDMNSAASSHFITAAEKSDVNDAVRKLIKPYNSDQFKLTFSGGVVVVDVFNKATLGDMKRLVKIMALVVLVLLYAMFHRIAGIIVPQIVVGCATITTMGMMALTNTPISIMTNIIPAFLVAVCVAAAIHVMAIFFMEYQKGKSKEDAVCKAVGHAGMPIAMTSLTTAAGLLSFATAKIATIIQMGYFAAFGVIVGWLFTVLLVPAVVAVIPIRRKKQAAAERHSQRMDTFLLWFGTTAIRHPMKIISLCVVFLVTSIYFCFQLHFSNWILDYFPNDHPVKLDLLHVEDKLGGAVDFDVVVDTHKENGLHDPDLMNRLERVSKRLEAIKNDTHYVGKVISITSIIKETNQALHNNDASFYTLPGTSQSIAQELLLFETSGSEDLHKLCDSKFSKARLIIRTKWEDSVVYKEFVKDLKDIFTEEIGNKATVTITGLAALMARTIPAALSSMARSYIMALVVITIMMIAFVGQMKLGLISMCPNLLPIFMVFGLISAMGVNLDINTLFIGSVALGLVVDDTIHYIYNFQKFYKQLGSVEKAIRLTFLQTGRALVTTSIVLCMNFFVLLFSTLNHSIKFGLFTGISIIFALLADFFLTPAMVYLFFKDKKVD